MRIATQSNEPGPGVSRTAPPLVPAPRLAVVVAVSDLVPTRNRVGVTGCTPVQSSPRRLPVLPETRFPSEAVRVYGSRALRVEGAPVGGSDFEVSCSRS